MLRSSGYFGGVIGYAQGKVETTGNIIINSTIGVFPLGVASVKVSSCVGKSIVNASCMLDENIVFSGPTSITTADGSGSIYRYVMSDATDKCRWSKLPFITDNCAKDEKVFMVYKPSISGGLYGDEAAIEKRTLEPATKPTTVIIVGASAAVCALCGGCYYCKKHHNGAFCFSGHRALSTDETVATDNEQDGDESYHAVSLGELSGN